MLDLGNIIGDGGAWHAEYLCDPPMRQSSLGVPYDPEPFPVYPLSLADSFHKLSELLCIRLLRDRMPEGCYEFTVSCGNILRTLDRVLAIR